MDGKWPGNVPWKMQLSLALIRKWICGIEERKIIMSEKYGQGKINIERERSFY
jgi:hypothetical protein